MNQKINILFWTFFIILITSIPFAGFTQITDNNSLVKKGAELKKTGEGYSFTEGPAVDKDGNVFFTDQPNNKIVKWDAKSGELSVFLNESGRSNGMYFDKKGNLITCADMDNQMWLIDKSGNRTIMLQDFAGKLLNGPNDLWIHPKTENIYFTDPLYKRPYWTRNPEKQQDGEHVYLIKDGKTSRVAEDLVKPNGIIGTPDGKKLYVADIGANKTYVYDIAPDGKLSNRKLFAELGSDGMTIDNQGNIYLTGKGVTVFDKTGKQIGQIPVPENWTANVCFGGKELKTLFITAMGSVYTLDMNVKGVR
jgi:gluconolactonase